LLAECGLAVSYEIIRRWVNHFRPMIAADLRKRRQKPHTTWHLNEIYLKIDGRMVYLWRAVDAEGEVLDVLVQSKRNKHAALKLMRKLLKKYAFVSERLVTDDLRSYSAAVHVLGIERRHERKSFDSGLRPECANSGRCRRLVERLNWTLSVGRCDNARSA
jgi:putative transposase